MKCWCNLIPYSLGGSRVYKLFLRSNFWRIPHVTSFWRNTARLLRGLWTEAWPNGSCVVLRLRKNGAPSVTQQLPASRLLVQKTDWIQLL